MSTQMLEGQLHDALHAYADAIPARPNVARLLAALDLAPVGPARQPNRALVAGAAAGVALLVGVGALAVGTKGQDTTDDPVVQVTATTPTTLVAPTTAAPATVAPTTVPPTVATTAAPAPPAPAAAPPVQVAPPATAAPVPQKVATPKARSAPTTAAHKAAPPTTAAHDPAPSVAFSAHAAYGSCSEDPPYDVYSGTASPGTPITISSPYGGGSTTADGSGEWHRKVVFAGAPVGESFTVTVSSPEGTDTFTFTHSG